MKALAEVAFSGKYWAIATTSALTERPEEAQKLDEPSNHIVNKYWPKSNFLKETFYYQAITRPKALKMSTSCATMSRTAVYAEPGTTKIDLVSLPIPTPAAGELLVRM